MVGFRYFVEGRARTLALAGWVRNGDDGASVEVVAEGEDDRLRELERALREGPRSARVECVESGWDEAVEGLAGFTIRW